MFTTHRYRGFRIYHDPKPIPDRRHDWEYAHEDYDGAPDSNDDRHGTAASLEAAKAAIDSMLEVEDDGSAPPIRWT